MNAKMCDRCKQFYAQYDGFGAVGKDCVGNKVYKYIFNSLDLIQEIEGDRDNVNIIDLCPECAQSFANWLEIKMVYGKLDMYTN